MTTKAQLLLESESFPILGLNSIKAAEKASSTSNYAMIKLDTSISGYKISNQDGTVLEDKDLLEIESIVTRELKKASKVIESQLSRRGFDISS